MCAIKNKRRRKKFSIQKKMNRLLWNFKIAHVQTDNGFQIPLVLTGRPLFIQDVEPWEYLSHLSVNYKN